jgi:DNA-binding HxlR family transcriptional regulator
MTRATPQPGRPVRGSQTGRPLMAALDLMGRRWALRLLWELRSEPLGARTLRERCDGMSSSVLYERLTELISAGLIAKDDSGDYTLTLLGADLGSALEPLEQWSQRWAKHQNAPARSAAHGQRRPSSGRKS